MGRVEQLGVGLADGRSGSCGSSERVFAAGLDGCWRGFRCGSPSISGDQPDYAPGALSGSLREAAGPPAKLSTSSSTDDLSDPWSHEFDVTAAADGTVTDSFDLPDRVAGTYAVTATAPSGTANASLRLLRRLPTPDPSTDDESDAVERQRPHMYPGDTVALSGANWTPGSTVHVVVDDDKSNAWTHTADLVAGVGGAITDSFSLPACLVASFTATATGRSARARRRPSARPRTLTADDHERQDRDT